MQEPAFNYKININLANTQTETSFLYLSPFDQDAIKQRNIIKICITKPQKKNDNQFLDNGNSGMFDMSGNGQ